MNKQNTYIRKLYAPGFSSLGMTLYKTGLTLVFNPWNGPGCIGDYYDRRQFLSTTIDYEKAYSLLFLSQSIIDEKLTGQINMSLACNNNTKLVFEYKPRQNGQMCCYLTIKKNGKEISFEFGSDLCYINDNGRMIPKVIHSVLGSFSKVLEAYLMGIGVERHLSKLTDAELGDPDAQSM